MNCFHLLCIVLAIHFAESLRQGKVGSKSLICERRSPYQLQYRKDLPWGEDIIRDVNLDNITAGRATVLALHTAHCLYCTTQAKYLGNMARDLQEYGTNISIVIINRAGYEDYIDYYMRHIKMFDHVYFLQDNWETNAWRDLGGRKDDFYIYDTAQRLVKYVSGREGSLTNFGWKDELYDMLSRLGQGGSPCDDDEAEDKNDDSSLRTSEFMFPRNDQCRRMKDILLDSLRISSRTITLVYFVDASVSYSVSQAKELARLVERWKNEGKDAEVIIINEIESSGSFNELVNEVQEISNSIDIILQDTKDHQFFARLQGFRDDIMIYDENKRLMFYNRSPKSDLLNNGWREELGRLISTGDKFCSELQLRELKCKKVEDWSYNEIPFTWMTFERFTVLSILKEGSEGVEQFRRIKDARLKMGHFPITHMAINPSSTEGLKNVWVLRELAENSRVHYIEDYTELDKSIINKLYGAPGDVFYYDREGILRDIEKYSQNYDLMSKIRAQFKSVDRPCF
ncbi:hypothetical protein ACHWQZ_G000257 [Mnemiopsis leidyi]